MVKSVPAALHQLIADELRRRIFDGEHIHEIEELEQGRTRYVQRERFTGALVPFVGGMLRKTEDGFRLMNAELKACAERSPSRS
jgi:hypothetical protein